MLLYTTNGYLLCCCCVDNATVSTLRVLVTKASAIIKLTPPDFSRSIDLPRVPFRSASGSTTSSGSGASSRVANCTARCCFLYFAGVSMSVPACQMDLLAASQTLSTFAPEQEASTRKIYIYIPRFVMSFEERSLTPNRRTPRTRPYTRCPTPCGPSRRASCASRPPAAERKQRECPYWSFWKS